MNWRHLLIVCLISTTRIFAQGGAPQAPAASPVPLPSPDERTARRKNNFAPPPLKNLRYDEDFSYLRDKQKRLDWFDKMKFIPLNAAKMWYLTLGGEMRQRYEIFQNDGFGAGVKDNSGYFLERYMLHADFHFGRRFRFFAQVKSGLVENRNGGGRPTDLDKLDINQAFADYTIFEKTGKSLTVRVGRQEVEFGSSRLVAVREGPNVRQTFDGARIFIKLGKWQFSPSFFKPVTTRRSFFDDRTNNQQTFWGGYAARSLPKKLNGIAVIYFNQLDSKRTHYEQGTGRERRETVGARIAGKPAISILITKLSGSSVNLRTPKFAPGRLSRIRVMRFRKRNSNRVLPFAPIRRAAIKIRSMRNCKLSIRCSLRQMLIRVWSV